MSKRKTISLTPHRHVVEGVIRDALLALCDDGTIWLADPGKFDWVQLKEPPQPRIYGEWFFFNYQSGTHIVKSEVPGKPYFYVTANATEKYRICKDLQGMMNGCECPGWLRFLKRTSDEVLEGHGIKILASGPLVDKDPPNLHWVTDMSDAAVRDRRELIDYVAGRR